MRDGTRRTPRFGEGGNDAYQPCIARQGIPDDGPIGPRQIVNPTLPVSMGWKWGASGLIHVVRNCILNTRSFGYIVVCFIATRKRPLTQGR